MSDVKDFPVLSEAEYNGMKPLASDKCIYEHMIEPKSYEDSLGFLIPGNPFCKVDQERSLLYYRRRTYG